MNTLWIDHKYVNLASSHLALFKRKDRNVYNMRCPFCGDSSKSKSKARGYFFEKEGKLIYRCHNCGLGLSLKNFLKNTSFGLNWGNIFGRIFIFFYMNW